MKVKSVTIETDKGDEITMGLDEVEDFMKAMRRLKKSCEPERPAPEPEPDPNMSLLLEALRKEAQRSMLLEDQVKQMPPYPPNTTPFWNGSGTHILDTTYSRPPVISSSGK